MARKSLIKKLFRRTNVRDAHDKYANIKIAHLSKLEKKQLFKKFKKHLRSRRVRRN